MGEIKTVAWFHVVADGSWSNLPITSRMMALAGPDGSVEHGTVFMAWTHFESFHTAKSPPLPRRSTTMKTH